MAFYWSEKVGMFSSKSSLNDIGLCILVLSRVPASSYHCGHSYVEVRADPGTATFSVTTYLCPHQRFPLLLAAHQPLIPAHPQQKSTRSSSNTKPLLAFTYTMSDILLLTLDDVAHEGDIEFTLEDQTTELGGVLKYYRSRKDDTFCPIYFHHLHHIDDPNLYLTYSSAIRGLHTATLY
jgi:hypothetical protein